MSDTKLIPGAMDVRRTFTVLQTQTSEADVRLQLRREIDRLALLIEEVKRQSDKVLAVADAIGDRMLAESFQANVLKRRRSVLPSLVKSEGRKKNGASSDSKSSGSLQAR